MKRSSGRGARPWIRSTSPWRITLLYIALSVFWISVSDQVVEQVVGGDPERLGLLQTAKGIAWVLASALLLHYLVFRHIRRIQAIEADARRQLAQGEEVGRFGTCELVLGEEVVECSEGTFRLFGADPGQGPLTRAWLQERIHPEDLARVRPILEGVRDGMGAEPFEMRIRRSDGRERTVRVLARARSDGGRTRVVATMQDVTELRTAEMGGRTTLALLRAVVEASAAGLLVVRQGESREILLWNDRYSELLGVPREVLERGDGEEAMNLLIGASRDPDWLRRRTGEIYADPTADSFDLIEMNSGKVLERYTAPVYLEGEPRARIWSYRDMTVWLETEKALRLAEERYRAAFENAPVGIAEIGRDLRLMRANPALQRTLGYTDKELTGMPVAQLALPQEADREIEVLERLLRGESVSVLREQQMRRKDGLLLWAEVAVSPVRVDGGIDYLIAAIHDVTDRHVIEEEREKLVRDVRLLLESTGAGLFAIDTSGRCTLVNRAACDILGYSADELLGSTIGDRLAGSNAAADGKLQEVLEGARDGQAGQLYNHPFRRREGDPVLCDATVSPIVRFGSVIGAVVSFTDVSDRRTLEMQLERAERLASLGRLATSISHEMNNVLMGILPFAEVISRTGEGAQKQAGEQIRNSVQRGRAITQEILRYARPADPEKSRIEAGSWVRDLAHELEQIVAPRGSWVLNVQDDPIWIEADPAQLAQVFTNLVVNARDALHPEGGIVALSLRRVVPGETFAFGPIPDGARRWVLLTVRDDGIGMDADTLRQLFEPFFTRKRGGTGLGLPIAQQILSAHGGLLYVESVEGAGTAFHVLLPEATDQSAQRPVTEAPAGHELPRDILLVEDDQDVAAGLVAQLEFEGVATELATTGRQALDVLSRRRPDVVILDVGLPDMDGAAVCEQALALQPGLPIIFSTGHGDAVRLGRFLTRPHVRFLMKPYGFDELRRTILEAVGSPQRREP